MKIDFDEKQKRLKELKQNIDELFYTINKDYKLYKYKKIARIYHNSRIRCIQVIDIIQMLFETYDLIHNHIDKDNYPSFINFLNHTRYTIDQNTKYNYCFKVRYLRDLVGYLNRLNILSHVSEMFFSTFYFLKVSELKEEITSACFYDDCNGLLGTKNGSLIKVSYNKKKRNYLFGKTDFLLGDITNICYIKNNNMFFFLQI